MNRKRKSILFVMSIVMGTFLLAIYFGLPAHAAGFVEDVIDNSHLYSRYDLLNYQLDFYVDTSSGWLPWNWGESIGQSVMYGIYALTNGFWLLSCLLAQGAGYIIQEAFELDFVGDMAGSVGRNIQTLAGVSPSGFSPDGFYAGCLLLLIVVVGIYVLYVGAFKRETTKAVSAVTSFIVIFVLSAVLIAYAPESISNVNEFSKDMTSSAMNLGLRIMGDETGTDGTSADSSATIRDVLWKIQVDVPWELLQFGSVGEVDSERVEGLKAVSPDDEGGKTREDVVKEEVEQGNMNLSMPRIMSRLGETMFVSVMSLLISIFVLLLAGFMMFSQILFIIYASYLPISFLLSMVPTFGGMAKNAVLSLFNVILQRVGITLVVVVTFSISFLLYQSVGHYPFLLVMFVQIVVFIGTFLALPELLRRITLPTAGGEQKTLGLARQVATVMMIQGLLKKRSGGKKVNQNLSGDNATGTKKKVDKSASTSDRSGGGATGVSSNRLNIGQSNQSEASETSHKENQKGTYGSTSDVQDKSTNTQDNISDVTKTQRENGSRKVIKNSDVEPTNEIEKYKNKGGIKRGEESTANKSTRNNVSDKPEHSIGEKPKDIVRKSRENVFDKPGHGTEEKPKNVVQKSRGNVSDKPEHGTEEKPKDIVRKSRGNLSDKPEQTMSQSIDNEGNESGQKARKNTVDEKNSDKAITRSNAEGIRQQTESHSTVEKKTGERMAHRNNQELVSRRTSVSSDVKERKLFKEKRGQDIEPAREIKNLNSKKIEKGEEKRK